MDVVGVVDGDTIRVGFDSEVESLRIAALDTEESQSVPTKPMTPWGKKAAERAKSYFEDGSTVVVEFPGTESIEACFDRYRDSYGRLLAYVHKDDEDYQELMIREGFSPYFTKYGYADFDAHHRRYQAAERQAQADNIGVWNQLDPEVNGAVIRNYDTLRPWWELRAEAVETYREAKREGITTLLEPQFDYDEIVERVGEELTVFTELNSLKRVGDNLLATNGSNERSFNVFMPDAVDTAEGQRLASLLKQRYIPRGYDGNTIAKMTRGYVYVRGTIELYPPETGKPEIEVTTLDQLSDSPSN